MTDFIPFFHIFFCAFFLFSWSFCSCGCKAFIRDTKSSVSRTSSLLSVLVDPAFRDDTNQRGSAGVTSQQERDRLKRKPGFRSCSQVGHGEEGFAGNHESGNLWFRSHLSCYPRGCGGETKRPVHCGGCGRCIIPCSLVLRTSSLLAVLVVET